MARVLNAIEIQMFGLIPQVLDTEDHQIEVRTSRHRMLNFNADHDQTKTTVRIMPFIPHSHNRMARGDQGRWFFFEVGLPTGFVAHSIMDTGTIVCWIGGLPFDPFS